MTFWCLRCIEHSLRWIFSKVRKDKGMGDERFVISAPNGWVKDGSEEASNNKIFYLVDYVF